MIKRIISFYESIGSGYEVVKRSIEPPEGGWWPGRRLNGLAHSVITQVMVSKKLVRHGTHIWSTCFNYIQYDTDKVGYHFVARVNQLVVPNILIHKGGRAARS